MGSFRGADGVSGDFGCLGSFGFFGYGRIVCGFGVRGQEISGVWLPSWDS